MSSELKDLKKQKRQERECKKFARQIRERFPSMPRKEEYRIAKHACEIGSGRIGRSRAAEKYGVDRVMAAVVAHIRHKYTDYEDLLATGMDRDEARYEVRWKIREIIERWQNKTLFWRRV